MGQITDQATTVYADGPTSNPTEPLKTDIRSLFSTIDAALTSLVEGVVVGNAVVYATRAALFADLAHVANTLGIVYNDGTAAYNGIYVKAGASGAGSWSLTNLALPSTFAQGLAAEIAARTVTTNEVVAARQGSASLAERLTVILDWSNAQDAAITEYAETLTLAIGDGLNNVSDAGANVLTTVGSVTGALFVNGTIDASLTTWTTTDFLPCKRLTPLYFSKAITTSELYGICFYDAADVLIYARAGAIPANVAINPPKEATQFRFTAPTATISDMTVTVGRVARLPAQEASEADRLLRQAYEGPNATIYNGLDAVAAGGLIVGGLNVLTETISTSGLETWRISPFLPVMGDKVVFSTAIPGVSPYGIAFYDRFKVKIGNLVGAITAGQIVVVPTGTKFFRFSHPATFPIIVYNADIKTPFAQQWVGKRVLNLGDSISANYNWMGELCAGMGMTQVLNASRSGRKMDKALFRSDDTTALVQADFAGVDLCFMLIGTNDVTTTVGSMADAVGAATFYGQTRQVIETIYGWNPETRFVICTLLWRSTNLAALETLCTAIKEIAAYYSIPVCDLRNISGFSSITMATEMSDGLHPDVPGYRRRLVPAVRGFLRTIDPIAALVKTATVTITVASPGVVSWTAHGLAAGTAVKFTTTGALPTGLSVGTIYYVVSPTTDDFSVALTPGGAAINTTGTQSGTHAAMTA